jgi:ABC-2 type transport system ATP-binding protein
MTAVVVTRQLTKRYGETTAVDRLDLEIRAGEVFGLLGPNGAGKTTTILMLLGLTEPTEGSVEVLGMDPSRRALDVKAAVGYLPDDVGFYDDMTGRQNLRYTARLNRLDRDEAERRITDALEQVGLTDVADRRVGGYSRGMRQRLGIADALVKQPKILILDEPTVNIDPAGVEELLGLVRRLADGGVTVLLSSHLLHQVQAVCDRIGIFVGGRLVAVGSIDELAASLDDRASIEVDATGDRAAVAELLADIDGVESVRTDEQHLVVSARRDVRAEIADRLHDAGHTVTHLRLASAELDAIYHRYFHEEQDESEQETEHAQEHAAS